MNCENIIKQNAYKLKTSRRDIDIAPDISHSDREKWAKKYASDLSDSNVADIILALSDTSVGSLAITGRELLFDNFGDHGLRHVAFYQIESVSSTQGGRFSPDTISLHLSDGSDVKMDGSVDGLNIDLIAAIINKAIQLSKQGELTTSNQNVSSFQLSERLKVLYFKLVHITPAGEACCREAVGYMEEADNILLHGFSEDEKSLFNQLLARAAENMK